MAKAQLEKKNSCNSAKPLRNTWPLTAHEKNGGERVVLVSVASAGDEQRTVPPPEKEAENFGQTLTTSATPIASVEENITEVEDDQRKLNEEMPQTMASWTDFESRKSLQSDSPQVEILLQEKMANYNKELKLRHVFMEEPAQQPQPMAEKCPSQSDGTLLPQLTPQITGTTVVTSALSDANNYRQRNPKSARELQELSQLLQASNVQQQQQMFHEPNVVHQNAQNPNPSSSAETVLRQPKRKMERNVLEEQSATMGTEPKYSRHHANCQPQMRSVQQHSTLPIQNFHQQQQNMQSALVGFPQPVSGQQFQPQMTQQHMFSVGPPNKQHMHQRQR
uniref:Uncharacterized protein n=1 Tax=Globodera pallida TaxID=36090 RepID=A0A183CKV5_GLOPA